MFGSSMPPEQRAHLMGKFGFHGVDQQVPMAGQPADPRGGAAGHQYGGLTPPPADPRGAGAPHGMPPPGMAPDPRSGTPMAGGNAGYGGAQLAPLQMTHVPAEHHQLAHAILRALGGR